MDRPASQTSKEDSLGLALDRPREPNVDRRAALCRLQLSHPIIGTLHVPTGGAGVA